MRLAIVGSREFNDYQKLYDILAEHFYHRKITAIVSGGAKGADSLARKYAENFNIEYIEFLPDWDKYGKSAGFIRNKDIVEKSDFVLAFWDGKSNGTRHSINIARELKKPTMIIYF